MKTWRFIKREVLFAEELTDRELLILALKYTVAAPFLIILTWMMFGAGYALQGILPW